LSDAGCSAAHSGTLTHRQHIKRRKKSVKSGPSGSLYKFTRFGAGRRLGSQLISFIKENRLDLDIVSNADGSFPVSFLVWAAPNIWIPTTDLIPKLDYGRFISSQCRYLKSVSVWFKDVRIVNENSNSVPQFFASQPTTFWFHYNPYDPTDSYKSKIDNSFYIQDQFCKHFEITNGFRKYIPGFHIDIEQRYPAADDVNLMSSWYLSRYLRGTDSEKYTPDDRAFDPVNGAPNYVHPTLYYGVLDNTGKANVKFNLLVDVCIKTTWHCVGSNLDQASRKNSVV
jgi:hypothetical protein